MMVDTIVFVSEQEYQVTNTCHLCRAVETREHLLRCSHASQLTWRINTISQIQDKMNQHQVQESIVDTLCSCITDWLDNGQVQENKYNRRYSTAIASQKRIG